MNIGYIKLDKLSRLEYIYRNFFKKIKVENNCYYIPSNNEKILNILRQTLKKNNVDYIVQEKEINCGYQELSGKIVIKYILPEILKYICKILNKEEKMQEIYVCVQNYNRHNIDIIEELTHIVKVVNIVTNHINQFRQLENRLEKSGIDITVSCNKRKALKRAEIVINLDFDDLKEYNLNRNCIIINSQSKINLGKDFEGICIEKVILNTNKVMRIFSEMPNMNKGQLIEAEILKKNDYKEIKELINQSKIHILGTIGKRSEISRLEFENIRQKLYNKIIA